jgi:hypothetical protein
MSQHNEQRQEWNQVFENTRQHNKRRQERNQVFENTRQHNELAAREDIGGTSMSKDRSNEVPNQNCVICLCIIDVNDHRSSMCTQCDHIFHRDCFERWMEEKVRF